MFVYTVTKKRALRMLIVALAVIVGIIIGIMAIFSSIKTNAEEKKTPIYNVERSDNKAALTFNCAWGNSNTDEILAILEKENVKSTFFVTGEFCDKYPEDVLKIFKAGHEIQSHSDKHPHVEGANVNDLILDTREVERKISKITGVMPNLYRAPYGEYDNNSVFTINGMGYKYIQWSVDSIDWQEPTAKTIVKRVVSGTKSGSIVLFHNDLENTTEALPTVISKLKEKGFDLIKVSDLIYWENYAIDNAGKQVLSGEKRDVKTLIHTSGSQVNSAFEILVENLTIEEIMSLQDGISPQVTSKLSKILSAEQLYAISALSEDELKSAWGALVEAKTTGLNGQFLAGNQQATSAETTNTTVSGTTATAATTTTAPVRGNMKDSKDGAAAAATVSAVTTVTVSATTPATTPTTTIPKDVKGGNAVAGATTPAVTTTSAATTVTVPATTVTVPATTSMPPLGNNKY